MPSGMVALGQLPLALPKSAGTSCPPSARCYLLGTGGRRQLGLSPSSSSSSSPERFPVDTSSPPFCLCCSPGCAGLRGWSAGEGAGGRQRPQVGSDRGARGGAPAALWDGTPSLKLAFSHSRGFWGAGMGSRKVCTKGASALCLGWFGGLGVPGYPPPSGRIGCKRGCSVGCPPSWPNG